MILGMGFFQIVDGHAGIDLGGVDAGMAEHLLDVAHRSTVFKHVGGAAMAQAVGGDLFFNPGKLYAPAHGSPYAVGIQSAAPAV